MIRYIYRSLCLRTKCRTIKLHDWLPILSRIKAWCSIYLISNLKFERCYVIFQPSLLFLPNFNPKFIKIFILQLTNCGPTRSRSAVNFKNSDHPPHNFPAATREEAHVEERKVADRSGAAPLLADKFLTGVYRLAKPLPLPPSLWKKRRGGRGGFFLWKIFHRLATTTTTTTPVELIIEQTAWYLTYVS